MDAHNKNRHMVSYSATPQSNISLPRVSRLEVLEVHHMAELNQLRQQCTSLEGERVLLMVRNKKSCLSGTSIRNITITVLSQSQLVCNTLVFTVWLVVEQCGRSYFFS